MFSNQHVAALAFGIRASEHDERTRWAMARLVAETVALCNGRFDSDRFFASCGLRDRPVLRAAA